MANYIAHCRSNYFHVQSPIEFSAWCDELNLEFIQDSEKGFALFPEESWPCTRETDNKDGGWEETDIDFLQELSEHLETDEVAIIQEIGYEKMRYLCGVSQAVNADGNVLTLCLSDMNARVADEWGINATEVEY